MRPARGLVEPQEELDDRALARAGGPDDGVGLAGRDVEVEAVEHVAGARGVAEAHVLEADGAPHRRGQVLRARADRRRDLEEAEDAAARRHRPLVEVERLAEAR